MRPDISSGSGSSGKMVAEAKPHSSSATYGRVFWEIIGGLKEREEGGDRH